MTALEWYLYLSGGCVMLSVMTLVAARSPHRYTTKVRAVLYVFFCTAWPVIWWVPTVIGLRDVIRVYREWRWRGGENLRFTETEQQWEGMSDEQKRNLHRRGKPPLH